MYTVFLFAILVDRPFLPYHYYDFAVQNWSGQYQIHGLWPQYTNRTYPSWCQGDTYETVAGPLLSLMGQYWNTGQDNQGFWAHEWSKHGTCAQEATGMNQSMYFMRAIELFRSLQPQNVSWTCGATADCVVACYDLEYRQIMC